MLRTAQSSVPLSLSPEMPTHTRKWQLKGLQQKVPKGFELNHWIRPRGWRPFYLRDEAFEMPSSSVLMPQVAAAMAVTTPTFKGRAWDPALPTHFLKRLGFRENV